jgi:MFS family permease
MKTDYEIVTRMRQLEKNRPNIYGNTVVVGLIQLSTFILSILLLAMYVMKKIDSHTAPFLIEWLGGISTSIEKVSTPTECQSVIEEQQQLLMSNVLSQLYLAMGLLMLFINRLTRMIGRRNAFLMDFVEILEEEKKA